MSRPLPSTPGEWSAAVAEAKAFMGIVSDHEPSRMEEVWVDCQGHFFRVTLRGRDWKERVVTLTLPHLIPICFSER